MVTILTICEYNCGRAALQGTKSVESVFGLQPLCDATITELPSEVRRLMSEFYFLNKFSNAARASLGRWLAGVEVSFSRVTRISNNSHSLRASFFAMRSFTGCMHSNRDPGSKYIHCLQECSSNPHFGHFPSAVIPCKTVPHCAHRDTARVPGILTTRGPKVLSRFGGGAPDLSDDPFRDS
jgi:hypothetical protein